MSGRRRKRAFWPRRGRIPRLCSEYKSFFQSTSEIVNSAEKNRAAIVLTTIGSNVDAAALARTLVEEKLAACVNVLPVMTSLYRWKGAVEEDQERQLVIKTLASLVPALYVRISKLHEYELPEFLVLDASGSDSYLAWIEGSVRR